MIYERYLGKLKKKRREEEEEKKEGKTRPMSRQEFADERKWYHLKKFTIKKTPHPTASFKI
ncbi:MAG: hypothetical protein ACXVCN_16790 [Bdellovibrio sp.]